MSARIDPFRVGDELPPLALPPLSRTTCALFAGASGDHNPIHIDIDVARAAGLPDVIGHGMLSMAQLGRLLTCWAPQSTLRAFRVRFIDVTRIGEAVTCTGHVAEVEERKGETLVRLELRAADQDDNSKTLGEATFAIPANGQ